MASTYTPGGGVLKGAQAQEESLCMRSTLYHSLDPVWYRSPDDGVIWSPDVLVFAVSDARKCIDFVDIKDRWYVDIVSCAAVRKPEVIDGEYADPRDEQCMVLKLRYILRACVPMGVKFVVLGALGCGAYGNPVEAVARLMKKVLLDNGKKYEDWAAAGIEEVSIAVLDDSPGQKVWTRFARVFAGAENVSIDGGEGGCGSESGRGIESGHGGESESES